MRDNFKSTTKSITASRVAYLCSNPGCRKHTIGPQIGGEGLINIGVASHITAAAIGGPRYEASLNADERRDASNCIWLCQSCSKLIDSDNNHYTVELLREWKDKAEERAFVEIASTLDHRDLAIKVIDELDDTDLALIQGLKLPTNDDIESVTARILVAATADIQAFKGVHGWPSHSISLNLHTRDSSGDHAMSVAGVAAAISITSEVALVAEPGTGKTTTLVQLADNILTSKSTIAVFVPLAEWSSSTDNIFLSLTRRNAFRGFCEQHFMLLAYHGRLVLLLDGWNELDPRSRTKAINELNILRRDYPLLRLVVSTRRQALDAPISGPTIKIELLSEDQQLEIARVMRGEDGEILLDQAWRTPGVRELIAIPLYLNALLTYATGDTMPTTKEEVLRLFVTEHENSLGKANVLQRELLGFHRDLIMSLAVEATRASSTIIQDDRARFVISQAEGLLVEAGQINNPPEPTTVLDVLVSHHILIRSGINSGVSFQHQQFQEWHASFEVERLIIAAEAGDEEAGKKLTVNVLDMPSWEEAILFACERLSRADQGGVTAVAASIRRTLSIDPMLAAEMIYRSSSTVWDLIEDEVIDFAGRWHKSNMVDRAVGFMITTGQPEFSPQIWSLLMEGDRQVYFSVLRATRRFRPSVLGSDVQEHIAKIPEKERATVISEIAHNSGIDGIELATKLAKEDSSIDVQFAVIESLQFRRADRFVTEILNVASDGVWPLLARKGYADEIADPEARERLQRERQYYVEHDSNTLAKIGALIKGNEGNQEVAGLVATLIESEDFQIKDTQARWVLETAFERYPQKIGDALLNRLKMGRELPFGCTELLKKAVAVDEGPVPKMVIDCTIDNHTAHTATAAVGEKTVGILIDRLLTLNKQHQDLGKFIDNDTRDEYNRLKDRILISRTEAFLQALQSRDESVDPEEISVLSELVSRHGMYAEDGPLQAESSLLEAIASSLHSWVEILLASSLANLRQLADVAGAIKRIPKTEFVEDLHVLLDENLKRRESARQKFNAQLEKGLVQPMPSDVSHSYTNYYQRAFSAIGDAQVVRLMEAYLLNQEFGFEAACVLKDIWGRQQNIPKDKRFFFGGWPDYSEVKERRLQILEHGYSETSPYAESIFEAIDRIALPNCTEEELRLAMQLAKIALSMPHGDKNAVISKMLTLPKSTIEKHELLVSLVLAGEIISAEMLLDGLKELLENAKLKPWLLDDQNNRIVEWLELFPFSDHPVSLIDALTLIDINCKTPFRLRRLLSALSCAPDAQAEILLGKLARMDPRFINEHEWLQAIVELGTPTSFYMLLDLICDGRLPANNHSYSKWGLASDIATMARSHPNMRSELLSRYKGMASGANKSIIEHAIMELADTDGLLVLLKQYAKDNRHFDGILQQLIERVALGKEELDDFGGNAYELYSVNIAGLRKKLFAFLDSDQAESSIAEACLTAIDELRDEHGRDGSEPRHPNITTGKPWPIVR